MSRRARPALVALVFIALVLLGLLATVPGIEPVEGAEPVAIPSLPAELPSPEEVAARAEAPPTPGGAEVRCEVPTPNGMPMSDVRHLAVFLFAEAEGTETTWVAARVAEGELRFRAPTADGVGVVRFRGFQDASFLWITEEEGVDCWFVREPEEEPGGTLTVRTPPIENVASEGFLVRFVSGGLTRSFASGVDGRPLAQRVPVGPVDVQVCRYYGSLRSCGASLHVEVHDGDELELEVEIPPRPAGVGARVQAVDEGWEVVGFTRDSTAEDQGLRLGDWILELDGEPVGDLELRELMELSTGAEGEYVELLIEGEDGVQRQVEVARDLIP